MNIKYSKFEFFRKEKRLFSTSSRVIHTDFQIRKFKFSPLDKIDCDGFKLNKWLKQGDSKFTFQCNLCKIGYLDCSNCGWIHA